MRLEVSDEQLQVIVQEQVAKALESGMGSYEFTNSVRDILVKAVDTNVIATAVQRGLDSVDNDVIAEMVSRTFMDMVSVSLRTLISTAFVEVLLRMDSIPEYDRDKREVRRKELAALLSTQESTEPSK